MVEIILGVTDKTDSRRSSKCVVDIFSTSNELINTESKNKEKGLQCIEKQDDTKNPNESDFEEAMAATGFGKFNILLLLCALPGFFTSVYVTTSLSYIMTSAECDLKMTLADMGKLNTVTYAGMFSSALLWGFLSDTLGRKKIMIIGFLALSVCEFVASLSQSYTVLSLAKYCAGFIFNGPFAILISYISEMHTASVRAAVLIYVGVYYSMANINLPLLAWGVIPRDWTISLFSGAYVLNSWQIFLMLFTIPPLATGLALMLLPESPKFLMSRGRNEEALKVFQKIFSLNKGLPCDEFPIKKLSNERGSSEAPRGWAAVKGGIQQLKPLLFPPHLPYLLLVSFIMSITMFGSNTLRLWFPQMATIIEDYYSKNEETQALCTIIEGYVSTKVANSIDMEDVFKDCVKLDPGSDTYVNSIIIGSAGLLAYLGGGFLISSLGKRKLAALGLVGSGACSLALYWATSFPEIVTLFAIFVSVTSLAGSVLGSVAVDLFPTSIRAMAVAIYMMTGRLGTVLGSLSFPYLLEQGCLIPFAFISFILISAGFLCFALPRTTMKKMD